MGGILGMLMAASNLYTTLAIGWAFGVAITACVMSFVIWNAVRGLSGGRFQPDVDPREQLHAVHRIRGGLLHRLHHRHHVRRGLAPRSSTGEGQDSADIKTWGHLPRLGRRCFHPLHRLMGVFLAIPLKRQMINHEQLRFPPAWPPPKRSKACIARGRDASARPTSLIVGIVVGAIVGILNTTRTGQDGFLPFRSTRQALSHPPARDAAHDGLHARSQASSFPPSALSPASCSSPPASSPACVSASPCSSARSFSILVVGPGSISGHATVGSGWVTSPDGKSFIFDAATQIKSDPVTGIKGVIRNIELNGNFTVFKLTVWSLWGGTAVMVFASLTSLALQWKTIVRAFTGVKAERAVHADVADRIEVPFMWMVAGMVPITIAMVALQILAFNISWWAGLIAVAMSFFLSLVACRATGDTDTTPVGAMGKVMQLTFAVLHPGQIMPNLASAGIAANSASAPPPTC
jgi:hypothetical protein